MVDDHTAKVEALTQLRAVIGDNDFLVRAALYYACESLHAEQISDVAQTIRAMRKAYSEAGERSEDGHE